MKATSTHIALAAVAMYGVLSTTYLYGQASKPSLNTKDAAKQPEKTSATDPSYQTQALDLSEASTYKTVQIERADAAVLAKQLQDLIPGCRIIGDVRTNQIIIHGWKNDIATATDLIKQLDVPTPQNPQAGAFYSGQPRVPVAPAGAPAPAPTYVWVTPNTKPANPAVPQSNGSADVANEFVKQLQPLLAQADQLKSIGNTEAAQKLQARIEHLLSEETRRANEQVQRAKEQVQRAAEKAQKAATDDNEQLRAVAEQDRKAAEECHRTAEQTRRTVEQIQRVIENHERSQEIARRAMEVEQRIAALSIGIQKLEAGGELNDKQKADLDEAKQQLKVQLNAQFDQRQQVESQELKQLRDRLDKLEKEISDRAQNRDNQINQRFQELTAPASQQGGTMTIKTSHLTLENLNGAKQLTLTSPEITISNEITPKVSVDPHAAPELAPEGVSIPAPADASEAKMGAPTQAQTAVDSLEKNNGEASTPNIELKVDGPESAIVGQDVKIKIEVNNRGDVASTDLKLQVRHDEGLKHTIKANPLLREIGPLAPGETKSSSITFRVNRTGKLNSTIELKGQGIDETKEFSVNANAQ